MSIDPQLEQQYNARQAVPEHPAIFQRWAEASRRARETLPVRPDLRYGPHPRQTLDLFPAPRAAAPLLVFIHGGYWQAMDKAYSSFLAAPWVEQGTAVAVLNYGLCPQVSLDALVEQVRQAVVWLWRQAGEYGIDPEHIVAAGHSAGGHLVAMLLTTRWLALAPDLPAALLSGGVAISGLFDLEPLRATSVNQALGLDAEAARRLSPRYLPPAGACPLVLAVGEQESDEFHRQSQSLSSAWRSHGVPLRRLQLPGCHHFSAVEQLADPDGPLFAATAGLLRV